MLASIAVACVIGFSAAVSYTLAAALCLGYALLIWADSSSLTAGTVGSALPGQRGATMAVHTQLGYLGRFFGPHVVGLTPALAGGGTVLGWGLAYGQARNTAGEGT